MISAAVLTRVVNFPINDALVTWNVTSPPANIRELWAPWEHVHTIRAALSVCNTFSLMDCPAIADNSGSPIAQSKEN